MGIRVLFVYSDISGAERYGAKKYYSGVGSLSAVLREAGHETELLYSGYQLDEGELLASVDAASPDLVAFSTTTHQYPYIVEYARILKRERPNLVRVCGGTHPTLVPEEVSANPDFDIVCVGEGEEAMVDLADALAAGRSYESIANLWVRRGEKVLRNPMRPLIKDLDSLPMVDREVFGFDQILAANDGWVDMMVGRGCPYNCSYCCNHALKARYKGLGAYVRFRSPEHVMAELRALGEMYAVKTINFQDDIFTLNKRWTLDFCQAYAAEFEWPFWINTRVDRITDPEVVEALAKARCAGIRVGVENGNEDLRVTVLNRRMSNADIIAAFRLAQEHGLKTSTTNMIGVPGETFATIEQTIDLNRQLHPDDFQFSVFYPYPMTELGDACVAQGLIREGAETDSYFSGVSILDLPTISADALAEGYRRFEALGDELALWRASPRKHKAYTMLLKLYGRDGPRLQHHLYKLRALRRAIKRLIRGPAAASSGADADAAQLEEIETHS